MEPYDNEEEEDEEEINFNDEVYNIFDDMTLGVMQRNAEALKQQIPLNVQEIENAKDLVFRCDVSTPTDSHSTGERGNNHYRPAEDGQDSHAQTREGLRGTALQDLLHQGNSYRERVQQPTLRRSTWMQPRRQGHGKFLSGCCPARRVSTPTVHRCT